MSKIFVPQRALGYVSNHIPFQVRYIDFRKENLIITCVGKAFHIYGCNHFSLISVSNLHKDDITCLACDKFNIYSACENTIYAWKRGTELFQTYQAHTAAIHLMLPFGQHLIAIDESSTVKVWDIKAATVYLEMNFRNDDFKITTILHPNTYVNKILFGSEQGSLQLWNINTCKLVYTFAGWGSAVTCLAQSPAVDVIAIGLANGKIILHNLKFDKVVVSFVQDWGLVSGISFRSDNVSIMATASPSGHVVFWDLEEQRVASQLMHAHNDTVTGIQCLPSEPLMLTSSPDNTLKLWIFDMPDGGARLLRLREGHSAPPTRVRFLETEEYILSAGLDSSLRMFHTRHEQFNKSLGRASYNRKKSKKRGKIKFDPDIMPPIIEFDLRHTREKEWNNVAAIHSNSSQVTTWSSHLSQMGNIKFQRENDTENPKRYSATSLCMTHCGNFVIIGYSDGVVNRFNVQSGILRATYGTSTAHTAAVRGVAAHYLNKLVATGGADGFIKFWSFNKSGQTPLHTIDIQESISFFRAACDESSFVAVVLDNNSCLIIDLDTSNILRKLGRHQGPLTDVTFSSDCRWLITTGMDCIIKTWDIPTGQLIDQFRIDAICTSIDYSMDGKYLATAHVDYKGIHLWANRTLYQHFYLPPISEKETAPSVALPSTNSSDTITVESQENGTSDEYLSPAMLSEDLLTLSGFATSRWQNLLDIDLIKKKNKPKAPPKKPKSAPFFLPTVPSLSFQFDLSNEQRDNDSKLLIPKSLFNLSEFGQSLQDTIETDNFDNSIELIKKLGPALIDLEIKNLAPDSGGSMEVMIQFLTMIQNILNSNRDFELAESYLSVFYRSHGSLISQTPELLNQVKNVQICENAVWKKVEDMLNYSLCVFEALRM